jgi:hypothetical protein
MTLRDKIEHIMDTPFGGINIEGVAAWAERQIRAAYVNGFDNGHRAARDLDYDDVDSYINEMEKDEWQ